MAIWIGYLQWMIDNGFGSLGEPILGPMKNILQMDATLSYDESGDPVAPEWPEAEVIVGNPPFLGDKRMRSRLGDRYVEDLRELYKGRVPASADLVCYWFERARELIAVGKAQRAGLLATQAIRGGANRQVLEHIKQSGDIFFAESDRLWIQEGVAVQVSMVGFDNGTESTRTRDGVAVSVIFPDLTADLDLSTARPLPENEGIAFQGPVAIGPFDIDAVTARDFLDRHNPHGRSNSDVIRPVVNASDITDRDRGRFIIDFGQRSEEEAALYEQPFEYVKQHVKPKRERNRRENRRKYWWRHGEPGTKLRAALQGKTRQLATPRVAKHRVFKWLDPSTFVTDAVVAFARDDDYFFGILQSRVHELWARRTGTQLRDAESAFRYTPKTCFKKFPFPRPSVKQEMKISEAAAQLDTLRNNWLNPEGAPEAQLKEHTLTNLYNARPTWLENSHRKLDEAVLEAYSWPQDISDGDILKNLLALNLERSGDRASN